MLAIHETLRKEFASLPLLVKGVAAGDAERAAVVGAHVAFLLNMLEIHHHGEDELVWPKLQQRCPDELPLIETMESQHEAIHAGIDKASAENVAWMADPSDINRAALHTTLIGVE